MPNCTFHIVDAFTAEPFTGNPCAVVTDADGIDPSDMSVSYTHLDVYKRQMQAGKPPWFPGAREPSTEESV